MMVSLLFLHKLASAVRYHLSRALNTEGRGVDRDIVIIVLAPLISRVEIVVGGAALVGLVDNVDQLRAFYLGVAELYALTPMLKVTVNENSEYVFLLAKHVIRASSDYNAAALLGIVLYDLGLKDEELIVNRHLIAEVHRGSNNV